MPPYWFFARSKVGRIVCFPYFTPDGVLGRVLVGFRSLLASAFLVSVFGFCCLSPLSIRMIVMFGWLWLLHFGSAGLRSLYGCFTGA